MPNQTSTTTIKTLTESMDEAARNPRKGEVDGVIVEMRSLRELMEYQKYKEGIEARKKGSLGIRFHKLKAPGAV